MRLPILHVIQCKYIFIRPSLQIQLKGCVQQARKWLFRPKFFSLSKWAQFLHVTLDLTGKRCPVIFSAVLFFVFEKFSSTSTGGKCALRWFYCLEKQKLSLERTPPGKKTAFLHTLFVENERETSKLKWGAMFFYKVEGHMPKLSSFGRGKKFRPKKSLTSLLHAALQEYNSTGNELSCKSYCDVYKIRFGAKQIQYERVVDCGRSLPEALVSLTFFSAAW